MSQLLPCPACQRHVHSNEPACPFCGAALSSARPCTGCSGSTAARVARATLVAAGAALLAGGCSSSHSAAPPYGTPPHFDAGTQSSKDGAPPADASSDADGTAK